MSGSNETPLPPPPPPPHPHFNLISVISREKLHKDGDNFIDWSRNLRMVLRFEDMEYVLDEELGPQPDPEDLDAMANWELHKTHANKVACVMVTCMADNLGEQFREAWPFDINKNLTEMFGKKARQERLEVVKALMECKMKENDSVCAHVQTMQRHIDRLRKLDIEFKDELIKDMILASLPSCYEPFILSYHMNSKEPTLTELHGLLKTAENGMKQFHVSKSASTSSAIPVNAIGAKKGNKKRKVGAQPTWKGKAHSGESSNGSKRPSGPNVVPPASDPKEAVCFYCYVKGHWK